jgi:hypothetical protein
MLTDIGQGLIVIGSLLLLGFAVVAPAVWAIRDIEEGYRPVRGKIVIAIEFSLIVLYMAWTIGKTVQ